MKISLFIWRNIPLETRKEIAEQCKKPISEEEICKPHGINHVTLFRGMKLDGLFCPDVGKMFSTFPQKIRDNMVDEYLAIGNPFYVVEKYGVNYKSFVFFLNSNKTNYFYNGDIKKVTVKTMTAELEDILKISFNYDKEGQINLSKKDNLQMIYEAVKDRLYKGDNNNVKRGNEN